MPKNDYLSRRRARERLEYGAVKPACDIVRVVHRQNEKENENGQR